MIMTVTCPPIPIQYVLFLPSSHYIYAGGSTISEDPEFGGVMSSQRTASSAGVGPHHGAAGKRGYSFDTRPAVGGALGIPVRGYDINSRNSSFASIHSNSSRKNSIAEVGIRISFA